MFHLHSKQSLKGELFLKMAMFTQENIFMDLDLHYGATQCYLAICQLESFSNFSVFPFLILQKNAIFISI